MRAIHLGLAVLVVGGCGPGPIDDRYGTSEEVEALEGEVSSLRAALGEAEGSLSAQSEGAEARFDALDDATSSLDDALMGVEEDLADLAGDLSDLSDATQDASRLSEGTLPAERLPLRERTVSIDAMGAYAPNSDVLRGAFGVSGVYLADESGQSLTFTFVVPSDYASGSMDLDVAWMIDETGCSVDLEPSSLDHNRVGLPPPSANSTDGFTGPGVGNVSAPATALALAITPFTISGHSSRGGLEAGDVLQVSINRRHQDACTQPVRVKGVSVRYLAQ